MFAISLLDPQTAHEMREAITTMILNRIDELRAEVERACDDPVSAPYLRALNRLNEAKYICATCLSRFQPRKAEG